jgi:hypothetical protein
MATKKKFFGRFFLMTLLLIILPMVIAPLVPLDSIKPEVENRISSLFGRQVTIGSMRLSLRGGPYLYLDQLTMKEDPTFGNNNFLQSSQVRADFSLLQFVLHRQVEIENLKIQSPDITFIKNPQAVWSWTTLGNSHSSPVAISNLHTRALGDISLAFFLQDVSQIDKLQVDQATVRLLDQSKELPRETLYRNVGIEAFIHREANAGSRISGRFRALSDESNDATVLKADMAFDLMLNKEIKTSTYVQGTIGPGTLESKNFSAENFKSIIVLEGGMLALNEMTMDLYDGAMQGNLKLNLATQQFTAIGEVQNLNLDEALASKLLTPGQLTGHINAQFELQGLLGNFQEMVPTIIGDGRLTSSGVFISSMNVSAQVARALNLNQIGDMNPGTAMGALEARFHIEQSTVRTNNLRIQQLDGLGDATSEHGWIKIEATPTPTLEYAASLLLSPDATAKVKTTSPLVGAAVTVFESDNRVSVPVNILGEVRNPQVQVDIKRLILGS